VRLVIAKKNQDSSNVAFLKISFSKDKKDIVLKDTNFYNQFSISIVFIQKILDISCADALIDNLEEGRVDLEGNSYEISSEERSYFEQDLEISQLYNKWASDIYTRPASFDTFPILLVRPTWRSCGSILTSEGIQNKMKGFETINLIESFLDSSGINGTNSRMVLLLPIYCVLKNILSYFQVIVHRSLVKDFSLHLLNSSPEIYPLKEMINLDDEEIITTHIGQDLLKDGSRISLYSDSLDLELEKKEISRPFITEPIFPNYFQYNSKEELILRIEEGESQYLELKLCLWFDPIRNCEVNKQFDVMTAIDSFLNSEGGILIIGVADDKTIVGLKGDYSILPGDRKNSNGFENKLRNLIQTKFFKTSLVGELIKVKFHRHELSDWEICVIEVGKSHAPIFLYNEDQRQHFFVRQGNRNNKLEGIELSDYIKRHFCNKITDTISNERFL